MWTITSLGSEFLLERKNKYSRYLALFPFPFNCK
jgi:hypothetical protein